MTPLVVGVLAATGAAATAVAAGAACAARRRAVVIGRVTGVAPPAARSVRSVLAVVRAQPRALVVGGAAAVVLGTYAGGPVLGLLVITTVSGGPVALRAVLRSRAEAAYDASLVNALDALGRSVRSGASLSQAVAEASKSVRGAVASDLAQVAAATARGRSFARALDDWCAGRSRPSVRLTVGALALAATTGGPPARVVEDVATALRTRQQVAREAHALAAQARLSALVVGLAPVGFMGLMCLADPRNARMLFGTAVGITCVVAGLTLDAVGALWMHRMSARVMR